MRQAAFIVATAATLLAFSPFSSAETSITHSVGITDTGGQLVMRLDVGATAPPADTIIEVDLPVAPGGSHWSSGGLPIECIVGAATSPFSAIAEGVLAVQVPEGVETDSTGHFTVVCETVRTTDTAVSLPTAIRMGETTFATPTVSVRAPYRIPAMRASVNTDARNKTTTAASGGRFRVTIPKLGIPLSGDEAYFEIVLGGNATFYAPALARCELQASGTTKSIGAEVDDKRSIVVDLGAGTVLPAAEEVVLLCGNATRPDYRSNVTVRARTSTLGDLIAYGSAELCSDRGCNAAPALAAAGAGTLALTLAALIFLAL